MWRTEEAVMKQLRVSEIAAAAGSTCSSDAVCTSFSTDTRTITPGALFLALRGPSFNGAEFARSAVEKGAAAVITDEPFESNVPVIAVKDTMQAFYGLASYYRSLFDIPVTAVTGSVGKTTVKEMIYTILSEKYKTLKTISNLNNEIGVCQMLMKIKPDTKAAVIEMGMDHAGEISRMSQAVKPGTGLITNIGESHIGNFENGRDGILAAKLEILDGLGPEKPLIINADNDKLKAAVINSRNIVRFAIDDPSADYRAEDIKYEPSCTKFTLAAPGDRYRMTLCRPGTHNVYNALAAVAAADLSGVNIKTAAYALKTFRGVPGRIDSTVVSGVTVVKDCYNASYHSLEALLDSMAQEKKHGRKILVFGDILELGEWAEDIHQKAGVMIAGSKTDVLVTLGKMARYTALGAVSSGMKKVYSFDSDRELTDLLCSIVKKGDTVYFKASHGMDFDKLADDFIGRNN
jgi:UDP-N-acetylmuramoyl-tripeptide--D-alanyl-D-alanine ligase